MIEFTAATFGELYADEYDDLHDPGTTEESVALIGELAGSETMLELAIGTGRMALPLAAKGHQISGIDGSAEMLDKLKAKPGGSQIPTLLGDFADVGLPGPFGFVFLVFNTLFNLTSQADQIRCFENVAARLVPGGRFLIETFVPDLTGFENHQRVRPLHVGGHSVAFEIARHDPVRQVLEMQRVRIKGGSTTLHPLPMRYAWPAEIDLMAQLAGLDLDSRWGGWQREPFTANSEMHVSVYRKPA
ncbi:MAG: class I SAM-dependent methyltransferase [Pseudomonadota bacterium]